MTRSPLKKWLCAVAAEFTEGIADGFIIIAGGAQAAQVVNPAQIAAVGTVELLSSVLIAGLWYVAAFVKKNPPPFGQAEEPPVT